MKALIKLSFLLALLLISIPTYTQVIEMPRNSETKRIEYTEVITVDSTLTKNILYPRAKEWIALNFKSANNVIQMDDKEAGILVGKGIIPVFDGGVDFTLKIQMKDGRYKYWFTDFVHKGHYSGGALENEKPDCGYLLMAKRGWPMIKDKADITVKGLITSLKQAMAKENDKSEW